MQLGPLQLANEANEGCTSSRVRDPLDVEAGKRPGEFKQGLPGMDQGLEADWVVYLTPMRVMPEWDHVGMA